MTLKLLTEWWNLIFVAPFMLALLYLVLYSMTGISFGEASADADMDADADLDADADVEADADLEADADAETHVHGIGHAYSDADAHPHNHSSTELGFHVAALRWIGVGRVPMSILLMMLLMTWSIVGFSTNQILTPKMTEGSAVALYSIPIAALAALLLTRCLSGFMGRYVPLDETYARRKHELLGAVGEALFEINETEGMVSVRDANGDLFQVACRVRKDQPSIAKGSHVKFVAYNARQALFYVTPERSAVTMKT